MAWSLMKLPTWELPRGFQPRFLGRATSALNGRAIAPACSLTSVAFLSFSNTDRKKFHGFSAIHLKTGDSKNWFVVGDIN